MKLDYYERHLLALAVEACAARHLYLEVWGHGVGTVAAHDAGDYGIPERRFVEPTLADALTALLTDLGVQVPERPSEEAVREVHDEWFTYGVTTGDLTSMDPLLLAAAVLEAGR